MLKLIKCIRNITRKKEVPNIRKELKWLRKAIRGICTNGNV